MVRVRSLLRPDSNETYQPGWLLRLVPMPNKRDWGLFLAATLPLMRQLFDFDVFNR